MDTSAKEISFLLHILSFPFITIDETDETEDTITFLDTAYEGEVIEMYNAISFIVLGSEIVSVSLEDSTYNKTFYIRVMDKCYAIEYMYDYNSGGTEHVETTEIKDYKPSVIKRM